MMVNGLCSTPDFGALRPASLPALPLLAKSRGPAGLVRPARPRATASASAGTSSVMTLPERDIGAVADRHRRDQRAVRADEGAGADLGVVLVEAVVVAGDRAGADVGRRHRHGRRRYRRGGWPWRRRRCTRVLHLDEVADMRPLADLRARPQPRERPDDRARGDRSRPRDGEKARMVTPSPTVTPGAEEDVRLDRSRRGRAPCRG